MLKRNHRTHDISHHSKYGALKVRHHPIGIPQGHLDVTEQPYNGVSKNSIHPYQPRDHLVQSHSVNDYSIISGEHYFQQNSKDDHHKHKSLKDFKKFGKGVEHTSTKIVNTTHKDYKSLISGGGKLVSKLLNPSTLIPIVLGIGAVAIIVR
jgi:hypothetical protein